MHNVKLDNYKLEVNDLIGIRVLHLLKKEWKAIHDHIIETWELNEKPKAKLREGDDADLRKMFEDNGCVVETKSIYRSIHYTVQSKLTKKIILAEIQVRTIFEEGWSEIDHRIRYPYKIGDPILEGYLSMLNRLAGTADEMGSYIFNLNDMLDKIESEHLMEISNYKSKIKELKSKIESLEMKPEQRDEINKDLNTLIVDNQLYVIDKPHAPLVSASTGLWYDDDNKWTGIRSVGNWSKTNSNFYPNYIKKEEDKEDKEEKEDKHDKEDSSE